MTYAVFGRPSEKTLAALQTLISYCQDKKHTLLIHKYLTEDNVEGYNDFVIFDKTYDLSAVDLGISIGGDGTFIRMSRMVAPFNVPILGVNTGRLGFLAEVTDINLISALEEFKGQSCNKEQLTLLELNSPTTSKALKDANIAVNEIAILRRDTSSLLAVKLYANDKFINNYWADGLIISTPTGSTAYSMACGGPIVAPQSHNLIITPISPHSLTVRPLIISDDAELRIEVDSRAESYLVSVDSRSEVIDINEKLIIKTSPHKLNVVRTKDHDYFSTLREKLMWGIDKREI